MLDALKSILRFLWVATRNIAIYFVTVYIFAFAMYWFPVFYTTNESGDGEFTLIAVLIYLIVPIVTTVLIHFYFKRRHKSRKSTKQSTLVCKQCGKENFPDSNFCRYCGASFSPVAEPAVPVPVPVSSPPIAVEVEAPAPVPTPQVIPVEAPAPVPESETITDIEHSSVLPGENDFDSLIPPCYIVLDIETTGLSNTKDRIIEIAANEYTHGKLTRQFHAFVNPGRPIPPFISRLTGISDSDVKDAPTISKVKKAFLAFIGNNPLVGHNIVSFDAPFIRIQMMTQLNNELIDTLPLSRAAFPNLTNYKLETLAQILRLSDVRHHRAGNDILVTNALFLACLKPEKYEQFFKESALDEIVKTDISRPSRPSWSSHPNIHDFVPSDSNNIRQTALTGKTIAFTGSLRITIPEAMQLAVDAGAILKSSVSKNLDYLVVGKLDPKLVGSDGLSTKLRYAKKLIASGQPLQIITEGQFRMLIR